MKKRLMVLAASLAITMAIGGTASAAPGPDIKDACGVSFGSLVSGARSLGTAAHANHAGGAAAFANPVVLAAHGCTV